ncbi:hypothetical protein BCR41DRAFT_315925 [Lobosporangium transversale]|uniref:Uncharacterized protein n=1 Tax=Lobosporangium transversale TaxID=64571 RepID=A0A1Y2FZP8_9FUNG|nr:hypothetical protein BCR41DRAFT_315925 [Lobosporangium transversale]ORY88694.1 hypothetical protein BCR41DRAFT_315925 [Lobosporangium transversale]|eukprot:XP_021875006.1 hypothetical protein BCR41DRAFT_315925 [Lobosporangium transversale]
MPLDVLGRTRATLIKSASLQPWPEGIPSKRESSARVDYVPALCTHRPSLLPIEWLSEAFGLDFGSWQQQLESEKLSKLGHLEENSVNHRIFERILRSLVFRRACLFDSLTDAGNVKIYIFPQNSISNQVRLPAELKHINKRRKRN